MKARFFQHTAGCRIIRKWFCVDTDNITFLKNISTDLFYSLRHDSFSPVSFSNIISHFGCLPVNISLTENTDTSHHPSICSYGKSKCFIFIRRQHSRNKVHPVLFRIRIWQPISKIILYFSIGKSRRQIRRIHQIPFSYFTNHFSASLMDRLP